MLPVSQEEHPGVLRSARPLHGSAFAMATADVPKRLQARRRLAWLTRSARSPFHCIATRLNASVCDPRVSPYVAAAHGVVTVICRVAVAVLAADVVTVTFASKTPLAG